MTPSNLLKLLLNGLLIARRNQLPGKVGSALRSLVATHQGEFMNCSPPNDSRVELNGGTFISSLATSAACLRTILTATTIWQTMHSSRVSPSRPKTSIAWPEKANL